MFGREQRARADAEAQRADQAEARAARAEADAAAARAEAASCERRYNPPVTVSRVVSGGATESNRRRH